ncbi:hypothetical protein BH18ACT4_BH18ACT4_13630 [soil metagenome]
MVAEGALTFVVRVWLPDRPGALAAVATRIGAVRGDVVGIDILERGGGQAIDELVVELPDAGLVELLAHEIAQVDGVAVEEIRPVAHAAYDPRLDALETAGLLVGATEYDELVKLLCERGLRAVGGDWAVVVDVDDGTVAAGVGQAPPDAWVAAFIAGSRSSDSSDSSNVGDDSPALFAGPDDVLWADMPASGLALVMGRSPAPFRARERLQAVALAGIADVRCGELSPRHSGTEVTTGPPAA